MSENRPVEVPDRITFRVGDLRTRLAKWCEANNATPSEAVRIALADMLGRKQPPVMKRGNPNFGKKEKPDKQE